VALDVHRIQRGPAPKGRAGPEKRQVDEFRTSMMQAHSAPIQIVFYEGNDFPASYKGSSAFVATRLMES